jgi:hypothetical protein
MANYQIIQNTLLKNRFFYEFLLANERNVSKECRDEYVNTLSKIYYSYFKEYSSKLTKLQVFSLCFFISIRNNYDYLSLMKLLKKMIYLVLKTNQKQISFFIYIKMIIIFLNFSLTYNSSIFSSKPVMKNRSTIFTLGNRAQVIHNDIEASIVVPHASIKSDQKVKEYFCVILE